MESDTDELRPVESDGVAVVTAGTVLWLIALVVLALFHTRLRHDGHLWWIAVAAIGFGLGVLGIWYCRRLRARQARR